MKKIFTRSAIAAGFLSMTLLSALTASADHFTYVGLGTPGRWSDVANFYDSTTNAPAIFAPGSADDVEITASVTGLADGSVSGGSPVDINNLIVDSGATMTITGGIVFYVETNLTNKGTLNINPGNFVYIYSGLYSNSGTTNITGFSWFTDFSDSSFVNTGNINIGGLSALKINAGFYNSGNINNTDGVSISDASFTGGVQMNGGSSATISGNGFIDNLVVNQVTFTSISIGTAATDTLHVRNMLLLEQGDFNTNNRLVLSASAITSASALPGTGMIGGINTGGGISASLTGGVTVSQYIPAGRRAYRFYSHPFTLPVSLSQVENGIDITGVNGATNGFTPTASNNPSAMWFNAATGNDDSTAGTLDPGWNFFANTTSTSGVNSFQQYEGINLLMRGAKGEGLGSGTYTPSATTITIYGDAVNTGTQTITLHTGPHGTFNMVGNPYPCVIDLGDLLANGSNAPSLGSTSFFVWDPYSGAQGAYTTIVAGTPYYLQPNTAFQVESASADEQTLTFQETDKYTNLASNPELLRQQNPAEKNQMVQLKVYDAAYHPYDMFYLQLTNTATNGKEKADAGKPSNPDFNLFSVASTGEHLAVDARPYVAGDVIPMGVNATTPQTFIIRAEDYYAPAGTVLYLHDKYMGVYTQLAQGEEYKFDITTDPNSQGGNRFELRMGDVTSTETVKAATGLSINVTPNPATAEINVAYNAQATGNTTIRITNMMGQQVYTTALGAQQSGNVTVPVTAIPAGMYIVTLSCGDKTTTQRFVKE